MSREVPGPARVEAALRRWLDAAGVVSYDPYDGLACGAPWSLLRHRRMLARGWTQIIKRSPVNLRPFVGIRPQVHAKSLADLALAALIRARIGTDPAAAATARHWLARLREHVLPGRAGACWGTPFPYVTRYIESNAGDPNLYWTVCAASAFVEAYELAGDATDLALARSAMDFVRRDLGTVDEGEGGVWFRYFVGHEAAVYNVAALTGALMLRIARLTGEPDLAELGRRALRFVLGAQNTDGSWYYARGPEGRWVDGFHTGFVLESLLQAFLLEGDRAVQSSLHRGAAFYRNALFTAGSVPRYSSRSLYPIDVQNCAQAIQTLAKLCWIDPEALAPAQSAAKAVVAALFRFTRSGEGESGYFLLSRSRWFANALPAVRWGQAPMLLALAYLLAAEKALRPGWELAPRPPALA